MIGRTTPTGHKPTDLLSIYKVISLISQRTALVLFLSNVKLIYKKVNYQLIWHVVIKASINNKKIKKGVGRLPERKTRLKEE
ncbi:hypothetical protein K9L97_00900 [Candidatus Woesearchaeota archaeon]|nr:hypothetical protein [Candidatus Woesearchaeota archaeon]